MKESAKNHGGLGSPRPKLLWIDLFCGAGGVTTGLMKAVHQNRKFNKVIAAVNHDQFAIASHRHNHPKTMHFNEGVQDVNLESLVKQVEKYQANYPNSKVCIWASPDCTNFSKAKGGKPKNPDSRTQPNFVLRYLEVLKPDYLLIENVEEIMSWGPLNEDGRPESKKNGREYLKWINRMVSKGYRFDHRMMNAANYGAHTSRTRWFGIAAKGDLPIVFPEITHERDPKPDLFGTSKRKWKPVREVLDLDDTGESIFNRKKPLVNATLNRIYAGLEKWVEPQLKEALDKAGITPDTEELEVTQWLMQSGTTKKPMGKVWDTNRPCRVVTTAHNESIVTVSPFISAYFGSGKPNYARPGMSSEAPAPTVGAQQRLSVVSPILQDGESFFVKYYGSATAASIDTCAHTVTGKDRFGLVKTIGHAAFLDKQYGSGSNNHSSCEAPCPTLTSNPKVNIVVPTPIMGSELHTSPGNQAFILNPQYNSAGQPLDKPSFTIIARTDKAPPYLVQADQGKALAILIYESDCEAMVKIKRFMAKYGLLDIRMRMLKIDEIKLIQGFPASYHLEGSQERKKRQLGNAVIPVIPQRWTEALYQAILDSEAIETGKEVAA